MILSDTGYIIALVNPRDELHARAQAWAKKVSEPILITEYIIWEAVNFFSTPVDRPKAKELVDLVRAGLEIVSASPDLFEAGMRLHSERPDKSWSLTDCISFVVMERRGIRRALSYDHHFEQAGYEALLRRDP